MKTKNQMKPLARLIATSLAVGTMAGFGAQAFAATAAGTLIKNLATVTYEDESGNEYSAQSNEAVVTVAPVASATVEDDNELSAAPGQTVYFPHTISNTGNVADSYGFSVADTSTTPSSSVVVYHDQNGNGQPDPGEPELSAGDLVSVPAGDKLNVVVALAIPTDAVSGDEFSAKLTTISASGAIVDDIGVNSDAAEATSDDKAIVSTGPVLVLNKSSVHNESDNTITYTLTVKNNGASDATNVNIVDALPQADTNDNGAIDAADPQMSLVVGSISISGLVNTADGDVAPTTTTAATGQEFGDLNDNGVSDEAGLNIIVAEDATLPANTTVTLVYTVSYDPTWSAGTELENTFVTKDDETGVTTSNTTNDVIPQTYGVDALDTGTGTALGTNDGGDDDIGNDSQYVDVASTGAEVLFQHEITNEGNGDDVFNLDIANTSFPAGTVFTFWDETGTVQLTDTDNDGVPDTGILGSDIATTIMVKAKLPAGISGSGSFDAVLTATSAEDPSGAAADNTILSLGAITPPSVDIANLSAPQGNVGFGDDGTVNAQDEGPVVLAPGSTGGTVIFDLMLANESGSADSYTLGAGDVPQGWNVVFKDLAGNIITTTTLVPGGGTFEYKAEVSISDDPAESLSDSDRVGDVDGYDALDNSASTMIGADLDNDYQLSFSATSTSTPSLTDTVINAVDVEAEREVIITPNGQNQIQPGGTVDYSHKLENNGNQTELVELDAANTQAGWTTVINVDTNNDGIPDTVLNPATMTQISGVDDDGNFVVIEVTDADGDGVPELNLEPGENVNFTTTVKSPSNAPLGMVDLSTISVTEADAANTPIVSAEDQTTVILGQVRLDKTAAIDYNCDGTPETTFATTQLTQVEPGQCVVWNLTATNEGSATVKNVVISDAAPAFTDVVSGLLKFCHGNACTPVSVTDAPNTDAGTYANGIVNFFAGNADDASLADPLSGKGGELVSGEQASGQFTVKVQ
jgi:uncharacterized repeat protein (TIGR01451 family)